MSLKRLAFSMAALLASSAASAFFAGTPVSTAAVSANVDNGYAGLKWTFDGGFYPDVVVGFRHASVSSNGDTYGGDLSFSFKVFGGLQPGKIRLKYFNGADYLQAEAGGGYDFAKGLFVGIGGNAPFSNLGLDYHFTHGNPLEPYFMLDSLGQYSKPATRQTCPAGFFSDGSGSCTPQLD